MTDSVHEVREVTFVGDRMVLEVDGKTHSVDLAEHSPRLMAASDDERRNCVVSPSGYGIHWPGLDEDLSVDRLVGVTHEAPSFLEAGKPRPAREAGHKPARHPA